MRKIKHTKKSKQGLKIKYNIQPKLDKKKKETYNPPKKTLDQRKRN